MPRTNDAPYNVVEFSVGSHSDAPPVTPSVDGIPLSDLVLNFELTTFPEHTGRYGGIIPRRFRYGPLDTYFKGKSADDYFRDRVYLLGCHCGEVGCWPLEAEVVETGTVVRWSGFRQPHRKQRDYGGFGPFTFDAVQYNDALRRLLADPRLGDG